VAGKFFFNLIWLKLKWIKLKNRIGKIRPLLESTTFKYNIEKGFLKNEKFNLNNSRWKSGVGKIESAI